MFLRNLFTPREERAHPSKDTEWYRLLYGLEAPFTTNSGNTVTEETSMGLTAVWSAVTQIASAVSSLPLHLYERLERGKKKLTEDPRYKLMHTKPNPEQTSMVFRECQTGQLLLWGNCYAEQERDESGKLIALWPLLSKHMEVYRMPQGLLYKYLLPGEKPVFITRENMLHIVGFSSQGLMGYNPIMKHKNSIGLGLALDEYAGRFFANGARPSAVLEHPLQLSQDAQDRLRENWNKIHQGLSKSHRVAILEEGMKLREFGFSAADAQTLESRKFSITDVARIFNMPPHMLKDLGNATFSNISSQGEDFVRYCLGPWLIRKEQHYTTQLLSDKESDKMFFEHSVEGLLRGTISERYSSYATGMQWGWLSVNKILEKENENPVEGGDVHMVPLNMMPLDQVGKTPEFAPGGEKPGGTPGKGTENKTGVASFEDEEEVAELDDDPFSERGSGNFGHAGRPGHVGGSAPRGRPMSSIGDMAYCVRDIDENGEERKNPVPDKCKDIVKGKDGKYRLGGQEVSSAHMKRINALAIPPAWTDVVVAVDKKAFNQAIGRDGRGQLQYKQSAEWIAIRDKKKFDRGKIFARDVDTMRRNNASGMNSGNVNSHLLNILDKTAVRVGTEKDLKSRVKAYGLTTFQNGHVKVKGSTITFDFIAKEGIKAHYEFSDKKTAKFLSERISKTKKGDMLFPDTNALKLNKHITSMAGKKYTAKDFRTYHANRIALSELAPMAGKKYATKKEKQADVKAVATKVSNFLRNTPDMAIKSYIEPQMWNHIGGLKWKK